jgi:hypothetical protein
MRTLHEFIMREAASTGQVRRFCKVDGCEDEITDRTRSKRCLKHRLPDPRKGQPNAKIFGAKPTA